MARAKVTYYLKDFDETLAKDGALCVMVRNYVSSGINIITVDSSGNANESMKGVGICRYLGGDTYALTIDSVEYLFNEYGLSKHPNSEGYKLLLGVADLKLSVSGIASKSSNTTTTTRGLDGTIHTNVDYSKSSDVLVETLNARDEFAISTLRELLSHTTRPSEMSDSEMNYYCNAAYRWAANMMNASADARGSFKQEEGGEVVEGPTRAVDVSAEALTTNTEKILNNIAVVLGRTDSVENNIHSKRARIQYPELTNLLKEYVKDKGSTEEKTLGLYDLIEAIKSIGNTSSSTPSTESVKESSQNVVVNATGADALYKQVEDKIDARIKAWLEKTAIEPDSNGGYKLIVPDTI